MKPRYNTIEWIREYFPEYLPGGRLIELTQGIWPILSHPITRETRPWRYAANVADGVTVNMQGDRVAVTGTYPYLKYTSTMASDEDFRAACDAINFFRNGGIGINPLLLAGGRRWFSRDPYQCAEGRYFPAKGGEPARFEFSDGLVITG